MKQNFQKRTMMTILMIVIPITALYIIGVWYYSNQFIGNILINEVYVSGMTVSEAQDALTSDFDDYTLIIERTDGREDKIKGSDIELTLNDNTKELNKLLNQKNKFLFFVEYFSSNTYNITYQATYDEDLLMSEIDSLGCLSPSSEVPSISATIKLNSSGEYEIIPEVIGNIVDKEVLVSTIREFIEEGHSVLNLSDEKCYEFPEIISTDAILLNMIQQMQAYSDFEIVLDFENTDEIITGNDLGDWIEFTAAGELSFDRDAISSYVKILASKYDTFGTRREFKTTKGDVITLDAGILGWQIDVDKTVDRIIDTIQGGKSQKITPEYKLYCLTRDNNDIGNTYVEVSISDQYLWFYIDGKIAYESKVVTGTLGKHDTTKGALCIWSREKGVTLGTYAVQGYETYVDYWMPIDWSGVGLHDATWRSNFGGSIYKTSGSHGCINMPKATAEYIYNNTKTGTPVLVY